MSLAAIITVKSEEDNVKRCATSVQFADEIIILTDKESDDITKLATNPGIKTFVRNLPGYGPQKNFGAAQAASDWLLFIDADEEVSPALAKKIIQITSAKPSPNSPDTKYQIPNTRYDFYWLKITTVFLNKALNHIYSYDPRLYRKSAGAWTSHHINEQLQTNSGQVIKLGDNLSHTLSSSLYHHSDLTIATHLKRLAEETALDAQHMAKNNQHRSGRAVQPSWYLPYHLGIRQFAKLYLYKRGILDGFTGLIWSTLSAHHEYVTAKKYLRLKSGKRLPHQPHLR